MPVIIPIEIDPFHILRKNLVFEAKSNSNDAESTQQNDKASAPNEGALDEELNDVREERDESQKNTADTSTSDNDAMSDTGTTDSPEGDTGDGGLGISTTSNSSTPMDTTTDQSTQTQNPVGKINRKFTLYSEYNRIIATLGESINTLSGITTDNNKIKSSIIQLQDVYNNGMYIMGKFKDYSEADLMIHLELIKKRSSIIIQYLKKLQMKNNNDKYNMKENI